MRSSWIALIVAALAILGAASARGGRNLKKARAEFLQEARQRLAARVGERGPVSDTGSVVQVHKRVRVVRSFKIDLPESGRELPPGAKPTWLATTTMVDTAKGRTLTLQRADGSRFTGRMEGRANGAITFTIDTPGQGSQRVLMALWNPQEGTFSVKQGRKTVSFLGPRGHDLHYVRGDEGLLGGRVVGTRLFDYLMRAVDEGVDSIAWLRPAN